MNRRTLIISAPIAYFLLATTICCSPSSNKSSDKEDVADREMTEALTEMEKPDAEYVRPKLKFEDLDAAMAYLDTCADHKLYAQGILYNVAKDSLEYCQRLLNSRHEHFIVVDKGEMRVKLYDRYGRLKRSFRCALGRNFGNKHSQGDCRTPEGYFHAGKVYDSADWHYTDENGKRSENPGQYGPRFMRIITPGFSSIGIHGTDAPWSVGKRRSHGCIRLKNEHILELVEFVERGMPVIILPGLKDRAVNEREALSVPADSISVSSAIQSATSDSISHNKDSLHKAHQFSAES